MSDRICKNCRLRIADNAKTCLFCGRVLTKESDNVLVNMYPAIFHKTRMAKRIVWSFTFALILIQVLLFVLNYYLDAGHRWSFVTAVVFAYGIFFRCTILQHGIKAIFASCIFRHLQRFYFLLSLDAGLGFHGWSVQYGMSCSILVLDLFLGGGMLINRTNWTSYLTTQVYAIALAVINLCIGIFAKEGNPLLAWIVLLVTLVLFGVAVLAGSRKAKSDLKRFFIYKGCEAICVWVVLG